MSRSRQARNWVPWATFGIALMLTAFVVYALVEQLPQRVMTPVADDLKHLADFEDENGEEFYYYRANVSDSQYPSFVSERDLGIYMNYDFDSVEFREMRNLSYPFEKHEFVVSLKITPKPEGIYRVKNPALRASNVPLIVDYDTDDLYLYLVWFDLSFDDQIAGEQGLDTIWTDDNSLYIGLQADFFGPFF